MRVVLGIWRDRLPKAIGDPDAVVINYGARWIARYNVVLDYRDMRPAEFKLAAMLLATTGRIVSELEYGDALFGDRADGGPLTNVMKLYLCRLRPPLRRIGVVIRNHFGRGYEAVDLWSDGRRVAA